MKKDKKAMKWMVPKLISLGDIIGLTRGTCTPGSSDVGGDDCTDGLAPTTTCGNGTAPS
jgi:hypothetical protein